MTTSKEPNGSHIKALLEPVRTRLWCACVCQAISALSGIFPFIAVAELGKILLSDSPVEPATAWGIVALAILALTVRLISMMAAASLTHFADLDLQLNLRTRMAKHLTLVPLGWFDERNSGEVKKALQDDVVALHHLVGHAYTNRISAIVTPIAAMTYLFWQNWLMAFAAMLPLVLGIILYAWQFRGYDDIIESYNKELNDINSASVEFVQGLSVIKTFGQTGQAYGRFVKQTNAFINNFWQWMRGSLSITAITDILLSPLFSIFTVLLLGIGLLTFGLVLSIDLLPAIILAPALSAPILALSFAQNEMMLAEKAATRISTILQAPTLKQTANPQQPENHRVIYQDVCFSYDGETSTLKNINLQLEPGTVTALVGPSGSGKSTLARLLPRFWDVNSGQITLGGVAVEDIPLDNLYNLISFVFQNVQLLRTSVRDNITMGKTNASTQEIESVAKAARIHERIMSHPLGYDAIIDEDIHFSGGEAQRISIARALLANAPIVVLDEATAYADPESENAIQDALSELVHGRTLLVIAHRLSTITAADQICVMDHGNIVESGQHDVLLNKKGLYAKLWAANEVGC